MRVLGDGQTLEGKPISVKLVASFSKTNRPCRGFLAGICRKGDACKYVGYHLLHTIVKTTTDIHAHRYLHLTSDDSSATKKELTAPVPVKKAAAKTPGVAKSPAFVGMDVSSIPGNVICRHFARGLCSLGATCKFAHVVGGAALPTPAVNPAVMVKKRPCAYFASGVCTRGEQCTFLHETPAATPVETVAASSKAPTTKAPAKKTVVAPAVSKKSQQVESESESDNEEDDAEEGERTCIECEERGTARWRCANCDDALYCDDCDAAAHRAKVMAKHKRSLLPPPAEKKPRCGECESATADVICAQCEVNYCASCDASVHKFKSLRSHARSPIGSTSDVPTTTVKKSKKEVKKETKKEVMAPVKKEKGVASTPVVAPVVTPSWDAKEEARQFVESVPKYDLSSDSDSESDEDESGEDSDDDEDVAVAPSPASVPVRSVVAASKKAVPIHPAEISSESSDDEEEEKPAPTPASKPARVPTAKTNDNEGDSDSDFDDVKPSQLTAAKPKAPAAAPSSSSSSESSSESSDSEDEEMPAPAAPAARPAAKKPQPAPSTNRKPGISTGSSHTLVRKIEAYCESDSTEPLHLDANLNGFERLLAHDCAERLGLEHVSVGEGLERHITVSKAGGMSGGSKRAGEAQHAGGKRRKHNQ